jgi:glycerophosphoryl diester phosphodiesterase
MPIVPSPSDSASPTLWGVLAGACGDCLARWRSLLAAELPLRAASLFVLAPLYSIVLRVAAVTSGQRVLTDEDLLHFVTSLVGVAGLVAIGVASVVFVAFEMAMLLVLLSQAAPNVIAAFHFTVSRSVSVVHLAARIVLHALTWLAPAAVAAALVYSLLLTEFDINFYLARRPPAFWIALVAVGLITIYIASVAVTLATRWFVALPAVLLEGVAPRDAYRVSRERTNLARWSIRGAVVTWFVASLLLSSAATALVGVAIAALTPVWPRSLGMVAFGAGLSVAALLTAAVGANLAGTAAFAAIVRRFHVALGGHKDDALLTTPAGRGFPLRITGARLVAGGGLGALATTTLGFMALSGLPIEDRVVVIAHRGAPFDAPENTLASVRAALDAGADWVEIDVQETADGEVVVFHDGDFMKAAGLNLRVSDATREDLAKIDLGARWNGRFPGERIPTLAQVLELCRGRAGVLVELKYYGRQVDLEQRVVDIVERVGTIDETMFMSLSRTGVGRLKALRPAWRVGLLLSVAVGPKRQLEADFLAINASFATRRVLGEAKRTGREIYAWTLNDPVAISAAVGRGVEGVITDVPGVARQVLRERAAMSPIARVLVGLADRFGVAIGQSPVSGIPAAE